MHPTQPVVAFGCENNVVKIYNFQTHQMYFRADVAPPTQGRECSYDQMQRNPAIETPAPATPITGGRALLGKTERLRCPR